METEQLLDARRRSLIAAATTWFGAIVVVLAIVVAAFIIDREQATVNDLHKQQQTLQDDVRALAERRDALKAEVNKYQRLSNQLKPFGLAGLGYHKGAMPKQQQLIASLNAHAQARQLETASLQPRGNVELRIFARNLENATNAGVVFPRLRDLGFKVATLRPLLPNIPTNAVWYGSGVDPRNAQLVALTLLAAGAQLRNSVHSLPPRGKRHCGSKWEQASRRLRASS